MGCDLEVGNVRYFVFDCHELVDTATYRNKIQWTPRRRARKERVLERLHDVNPVLRMESQNLKNPNG